MTQSAFDEPGEVGGLRLLPKQLLGHLLMVWAVDYIPHSPTKYTRADKPSDVIVVDCVDLDAVDELTGTDGVLARRCWWRNAQLIQALKPRVGGIKPMLARMDEGRATMGNPPYCLTSMTSDPLSVERAQLWLKSNPNFTPSAKWVEQPTSESNGPLPALEPEPETVLQRMARQAQGGYQPPPAPRQSPGEPPF